VALATYADLQAAIAAYLARPGDANITGPAPDFTALAESRIAYGEDAPFQSRPLRIRAMETTAVLTTVAGQDSLALPAGYLQMRSIFIQGAPLVARTTGDVANCRASWSRRRSSSRRDKSSAQRRYVAMAPDRQPMGSASPWSSRCGLARPSATSR